MIPGVPARRIGALLLWLKKMEGESTSVSININEKVSSISTAEHVLCRFMATAVFSRCVLYPRIPYQEIKRNTEVERRVSANFNTTFRKKSFLKAMVDCCEDPVIHERITKEIKNWIQDKAPGTADSRGCSKKYHFFDFVNRSKKT